jgi:hypothetical protein
MKTLTIILMLALSVGLVGAAGSRHLQDVKWSVRARKTDLQAQEPVILHYTLENRSTKDVQVPKSIDPFISVRFRLHDPDGHSMHWNGARFSFKYEPSELVPLKPGGKITGLLTIPTACPDDRQIEKGGYCFSRKGTYTGTAEFYLGTNAFYDRSRIPGSIAEGPYRSEKFSFTVR